MRSRVAADQSFLIEKSADTVWINTVDGQCVARFGKNGYEISVWNNIIARPAVENNRWDDFVREVKIRLGLDLSGRDRPETFSDEADTTAAQKWLAPVEAVVGMLSPYEDDPWGVGAIRPADVKDCLSGSARESEPWVENWGRQRHIGRIAWLVERIVADGGIDPVILSCDSSGDFVHAIDGFHRLMAYAFLLSENRLPGPLMAIEYDGFESGFMSAFPMAIEAPTDWPSGTAFSPP